MARYAEHARSPMLRSLEQSTLEFLGEALKEFTEVKDNHPCGTYRIDMYLPEYRICVECGRLDGDHEYEHQRQAYIEEYLDSVFFRVDLTVSRFNLAKEFARLLIMMKQQNIRHHNRSTVP